MPPPLPSNPVTVSEYNFNFDLTPANEKRVEDAKPAIEHAADEDATVIRGSEPKPAWQFDEEPEAQVQPAGHDIESREFSDDPVDTKLDLARAYLDMGDPEGARAAMRTSSRCASSTDGVGVAITSAGSTRSGRS